MRITAFRAWASNAYIGGMDTARRVGVTVSRRARAAMNKIDAAFSIEDEDGRKGSRAWWMLVDAAERYYEIFEHSVFERFPSLERLFMRVLGRLPTARERKLLGHTKKDLLPGARTEVSVPIFVDPEERQAQAELRAQIERGIQKAHHEKTGRIRAASRRDPN